MDELLTTKKVLICCGSGGVGKTTLAAALAVRAAELGRRVLVLTIDPARRLANALGLDSVKEAGERVAPEKFKGELFAEMLDVKKTFDDFIVRLAPNPAVADRVLRNNVYQQLSTALNGSQEYTSLEKLLQAVTSGKFDLVILDTPPTKHAIDFLNAPTKIHTLFQDSIIKWFLMPFATLDRMSFGLMNRGTRAAFKAFEKIAGSEFLSTLTEFFVSIRDWQKVLRDRTAEVHRLLTSSATGFVLVTGFNTVKIDEARFFEQSLKKGGYLLSAIIVNKAFPLWSHGPDTAPKALAFQDEKSRQHFESLVRFYDDLKFFYRAPQASFANFAADLRQNVTFVRLPDLDQDIHDIEALKILAHRLVEKETSQI